MNTVVPLALRHQPATLGTAPSEACVVLARTTLKQGVVIYAAAGLSMAAPTSGPSGSDVAGHVRGWLARTLDVDEADLSNASLEELGHRAQDHSPQTLDALKARAVQAFDFVGCKPNYGHESLALLMREGLAQVISVNWDCALERAGRSMDMQVESVVAAGERIQMAGDIVPVFKVHGCARRPDTHLALTQAEVDRPLDWAVAEAQRAIHGGHIIFVGLGTIGLYVSDPVQTKPALWTDNPANVTVIEPSDLPQPWVDALGDAVDAVHLKMCADDFFDELLRAIVSLIFDEIENDVQTLQGLDWAGPMLPGLLALREAVADVAADAVMRWWRDGVASQDAGKRFLLEQPGRQALMTVALLLGHDGARVHAAGTRDRLAVASDRRYIEIASLPGQRASRVREVHTDRVIQRREAGVYPDRRLPVTIVSTGHYDDFPHEEAPNDIAAPHPAEFEIGEPDLRANIRFVSASAGVEGKLAA